MLKEFSLNTKFGQAILKLNVYHQQHGHYSVSNPSFSPALLGVEKGLSSIFHRPSEGRGASVSHVCLFTRLSVCGLSLPVRTESRITASRRLFYSPFQVDGNDNANNNTVY